MGKPNKNWNKDKLLEYIENEMVTKEEHQKALDDNVLKDKALNTWQEKHNKLEKSIGVLEDTIRTKDRDIKQIVEQAKADSDLLIEKTTEEINKRVQAQVAQTNALQHELQYANNVVLNNFGIIEVLKKELNNRNDTTMNLIDMYRNSIISIEEKEE